MARVRIDEAERIGKNIEDIRRMRKISVDELVEYVCITKPTYYSRMAKPGGWRLEELVSLARLFRCSVGDLTGKKVGFTEEALA